MLQLDKQPKNSYKYILRKIISWWNPQMWTLLLERYVSWLAREVS